MKSQRVSFLQRGRVRWGTAIGACLVVSSILVIDKAPMRTPKGRPGGLATRARSAAQQPRFAEAYGKLPLSFEINRGQTDPRVKFLSRGSGYSLFLTGNEAVLSLRKPVQRANSKRCSAGFPETPSGRGAFQRCGLSSRW